MPGPTLPTELLAEIAKLAVGTPKFDFVQLEWADTSTYATLKALCLTSAVLNEIASPLLYRHVVLPTTDSRVRFLWTVRRKKRAEPKAA